MARNKKQGVIAQAVDKMLHPHAHDEPEVPAQELNNEGDPIGGADAAQDPEPKASSVEAGAFTEGKHHHPKFDKFQKGN